MRRKGKTLQSGEAHDEIVRGESYSCRIVVNSNPWRSATPPLSLRFPWRDADTPLLPSRKASLPRSNTSDHFAGLGGRQSAALKLPEDNSALFLGSPHPAFGVHCHRQRWRQLRRCHRGAISTTRRCHSSQNYDICENLTRGATGGYGCATGGYG
jgi:hypothetical protein